MKDIKELLQQFGDIQELPISEEVVGAYLEGNLGGAELRDIQNVLNSDASFYKMIESIGDIDKNMDELVNSSSAIVESPQAMDLGSILQIADKDSILDNTHFTFDSGESVFEMDFGHIDAIESYDSSTTQESVTENSCPDAEQISQTSDDMLTNGF